MEQLNEQWVGICSANNPDEYLRSRIDTSILQQILNRDYNSLCPNLQSLFRLAANNSAIEIFLKPFGLGSRPIVPRVADVLVGFILREPNSIQHVKVTINDTVVHEFDKVQKDEPVLACSEYFIPSIFSGLYTSIVCPQEVQADLIFGNLGPSEKLFLSQQTVCHKIPTNKWLVYRNNSVTINDYPPDDVIVLPPLSPTWKVKLEQKKEITKQIEEELVRIAWHPERLHNCLDCDDLHLIGSDKESNCY